MCFDSDPVKAHCCVESTGGVELLRVQQITDPGIHSKWTFRTFDPKVSLNWYKSRCVESIHPRYCDSQQLQFALLVVSMTDVSNLNNR